jgi:hypothetical protein
LKPLRYQVALLPVATRLGTDGPNFFNRFPLGDSSMNRAENDLNKLDEFLMTALHHFTIGAQLR